MIFRKLIGLGLLALMLFAFLGAFGSMRQSRTDAAWTQGYVAGQQAAAGKDGAVTTAPPMSPYGYGSYYQGHRSFFPGVGLFLCLLPLMFFGGLFMLFGGRQHWRHRHGPCSEHGPHKGGNFKPPWADDDNFAGDPVQKE